MDTKRLRSVCDICPTSYGPNRAIYTTHWRAAALPQKYEVRLFDGGYTSTVIKNWLLTWHRTFTHDAREPEPEKNSSLIHIHEWVPAKMPRQHAGWLHASIPHYDGIVFFSDAPHIATWSVNARRHLATFKKNPDVILELGTRDDFAHYISHSQVPSFFHSVFIDLVDRHLAAHADTIDVLVARVSGGAVAACFVAGTCAEIGQSYYITGFFDPRFARMHAMIGLVDWWMTRSRERDMTAVNFGDMCGPRPLPIDSAIGYSNFKTHFGVHRVWFPRGFWKIEWRKK